MLKTLLLRITRRLLPGSFRLASIVLFLLALTTTTKAAPPVTSALAGADAPTSAEDPAEIDAVWQNAASKFDGKRSNILANVTQVSQNGPFRPDWESLKEYQIPQWYKDAKFGIFIHWGVYSVPAFGSEWYPREMYTEGSNEYKHHIATYGPQSKFGYKDFVPMFRAEHFDPTAWARLFRDAGAKYVVPVFEHHDGFAMYDSDLSDWTAAKMGPHRDLMGDLAKAIRSEGLRLGASSHRVEHNFFLGPGRSITSDINDPQYAAFYGPAHNWLTPKAGVPLEGDFTFASSAWTEDWLARSAEIVTKYHPDIMYFDWWIGQASVRRDLARFAAFYYDASLRYGDHVGVINYKDYAMQENSAVLDLERGQLAGIRELHWQTDTSISNKSWGYIENDDYKSSTVIIHQLADIVSKNGNLLLNIGPKSDGTIPADAERVLREIGVWLKQNGDAIYGTHPWKVYGEGPTKVVAGSFHDADVSGYSAEDFRFTVKGDNLYAIALGWPTGRECIIHSLASSGLDSGKKIASVDLLGAAGSLVFHTESDGLHIQLPGTAPGKSAYVFRIATASRQ